MLCAPAGVHVPAVQVLVAQKVTLGVYKGVTTSALDELAAETAAALTSTHSDYAIVRAYACTLHARGRAAVMEPPTAARILAICAATPCRTPSPGPSAAQPEHLLHGHLSPQLCAAPASSCWVQAEPASCTHPWPCTRLLRACKLLTCTSRTRGCTLSTCTWPPRDGTLLTSTPPLSACLTHVAAAPARTRSWLRASRCPTCTRARSAPSHRRAWAPLRSAAARLVPAAGSALPAAAGSQLLAFGQLPAVVVVGFGTQLLAVGCQLLLAVVVGTRWLAIPCAASVMTASLSPDPPQDLNALQKTPRRQAHATGAVDGLRTAA
eukprot:365232-Chlamydomonas_euryale.AAC.8